MIEWSVRGCDVALYEIASTTCYYYSDSYLTRLYSVIVYMVCMAGLLVDNFW